MILFLSDLWPPFPGGAERLAFNLARDLMRRGEDVTALTGYEHPLQLDGPPVIQDLGFEVFDGRDRGGARVAAHLDEIRPDVVVTHALYAHQFERELVASGVPWVQVVLNGQRIPTAHLGVHITRASWPRSSMWRRIVSTTTSRNVGSSILTIELAAFHQAVAGLPSS